MSHSIRNKITRNNSAQLDRLSEPLIRELLYPVDLYAFFPWHSINAMAEIYDSLYLG